MIGRFVKRSPFRTDHSLSIRRMIRAVTIYSFVVFSTTPACSAVSDGKGTDASRTKLAQGPGIESGSKALGGTSKGSIDKTEKPFKKSYDPSPKMAKTEINIPDLDGIFDAAAGDNCIVLGDRSKFYILDFSNPESPTVSGRFVPHEASRMLSYPIVTTVRRPHAGKNLLPDPPRSVVIDGSRLFLLAMKSGFFGAKSELQIFDISDLSAPLYLGKCALKGKPKGLSVCEQTVIVFNDEDEITILDVTNSHDPRRVGRWKNNGSIYEALLQQDLMIVFEKLLSSSEIERRQKENEWYEYSGGWIIRTIDLKNPKSPEPLAEFRRVGWFHQAVMVDSFAYALGVEIEIFDVSERSSIKLHGRLKVPLAIRYIVKDDCRVLLVSDNNDVVVVDIAIPPSPTVLNVYERISLWEYYDAPIPGICVNDDSLIVIPADHGIEMCEYSGEQE